MINFPNIPIFNGVCSSLAKYANASSGGVGNSEALAIIASLQSLGATVTDPQQAAINTFIEAGQTQGWYTKLLRFYFPTWGSKSPCELDWITRTSGTYVGPVTHAAGYTSGSATGYFNTGVTALALGMSVTSGGLGVLRRNAGGSYFAGALLAPNYIELVDSSGIRYDHTNQSGGRVTFGSAGAHGIITGNVNGTTKRGRIRKAAGITVDVSSATTSMNSFPNLNIYFNGANNNGTLISDTAQTGAMFATLGMTDTQDSDFTLALKNLWETCTGLTLA
jgi:hypothetical protein